MRALPMPVRWRSGACDGAEAVPVAGLAVDFDGRGGLADDVATFLGDQRKLSARAGT